MLGGQSICCGRHGNRSYTGEVELDWVDLLPVSVVFAFW